MTADPETALIDVHVTCPDAAVADRIAEALVAARLAACVHVLPEIASVYRWQGGIAREAEVPLVIKTRAAHFEAVAATIRELHPYDVPAVHAVAALAVTEETLGWLVAETAGD